MKPAEGATVGNGGAAGIETRIGPGRDAIQESLGEWCLRNGLATPEEIDACLKIQRAAETQGRPAPRLGEILVARGILTHHQVTEALAAQNKQIRRCARCGIQINVALRGDAAQYRCGRCNGALTSPSTSAPLHAVDEPFILVSKDPLPSDVEKASQDPANRFGKYVLLRLLGRGGIGAVYLAWDNYLSQYVALKRLLAAPKCGPHDTPGEHIQSLLKEARNTIRLRHPGVVSVFDVGRVDREYYVAMEYLEGDTLAARISAAREQGRPSSFYENPRATLSQLVEVARAVDYAHGRPSPIIHCDLKPANILIDPDGHPHVLDFGLAKNLVLDKPEKGEISGTPSYMAPEQASGDTDKIDRRTDVYAFGAILYELLTGRPPFVGGTMEILGMTIVDEPDRPSDTLRETTKRMRKDDPSGADLLRVPPALEELCLKCLKKDRGERPQSMEQVAQVLETLIDNDIPAASPETPLSAASLPSTPAPCLPPQRRSLRRLGWAVAILAALGAAAGIGFIAGRAGTASAERRLLLRIAQFRPEQALEEGADLARKGGRMAPECGAAVLIEEARRVAGLKQRLRVAVSGSSVPLAVPGLPGKRLEVADDSGVGIRDGERLRRVGWDEMEPLQIAILVETAMPELTPDDRLALGLFLLRAEQPAAGSRQMAYLRNTPLWIEAGRYLHGLER